MALRMCRGPGKRQGRVTSWPPVASRRTAFKCKLKLISLAAKGSIEWPDQPHLTWLV